MQLRATLDVPHCLQTNRGHITLLTESETALSVAASRVVRVVLVTNTDILP